MHLQKLKQRLEKIRQDIMLRLKELETPPEFGTETYDEESHESQEFMNQLSVAQDLKSRLTEIESALLKISHNKYGICEGCGKEISEELLEVVPESRLCKKCKKKSTNNESVRISE